MKRGKSAAAQDAYRDRRDAGQVGEVPAQFRERVLDLADLTPGDVAALEHESVRLAHACLAGWLLGIENRNTRDTYRNAWQAWCRWCAEVGESWIEPKRQSGGAWLAAMEGDGLSPATRRVRAVAVRQALLELTLEGLRVGPDPFLRARLPKVSDVSSTVPLLDDEMALVLAAATQLGGRYRTLVLLLSVVGLRATEAAQVVTSTVRQSPWGMVAVIVRKGGEEQIVPLPQIVVDAAAVDGWPLDGVRAQRGRDRVTYMVGQVAERSGVAGLHPHQFRHWHVTKALELGVPIERVQDSVNHASPTTTQRYNRARHVIQNHSAFVVERFLAG